MRDILLINSPVRDPEIDAHARGSPPLGLGYLAAVLAEDGFTVGAIDMNIPDCFDFDWLANTIAKQEPKLIGIAAYTETYPNALRIARIAKEVDPHLMVVTGGPHVTFLPDHALHSGWVDAVVRGEGEHTLLEIARKVRAGQRLLQGVQGVSFVEEGVAVHNPSRHLVTDLDSLPIPSRHLFPLYDYQFPLTISTGRGCPGRCIFCAAEAMSGGRYRVRSPESVVGELAYLVERFRAQYFTIIDDSFTAFPVRAKRICELMRQEGLRLRWGCCTRANLVNRRLLEALAESGCVEIQFGVESASEVVLRQIRKGIRVEQVRRAVAMAREFGLQVLCSFMLPHPADTLESLSETKNFMLELLQLGATLSLSVTTPFPGTYLAEHLEELGVRLHSTDWEDFDACTPIISTPHLSVEQVCGVLADIANDPELVKIPARTLA